MSTSEPATSPARNHALAEALAWISKFAHAWKAIEPAPHSLSIDGFIIWGPVLYEKHRNDDPSATLLLMPMLIHLGLGCGVGLAGGVAFGIGAGASRPLRLAEAALAGIVGAMVGTFVFEMAGAILFPLASTAYPFSATPGTRLLARLCVAGFVALGALRALPSAPRAAAH